MKENDLQKKKSVHRVNPKFYYFLPEVWGRFWEDFGKGLEDFGRSLEVKTGGSNPKTSKTRISLFNFFSFWVATRSP